jgi:hypothetical protein
MGILTVPPVAGLQYVRTVFLSSGTFTLPTSAFNKFDCVLVSGGGGGARAGGQYGGSGGGSGTVSYFHDIFCSNGTTLTVTVGSGGAGATSNTSNGANGTASTITGLTGNGTSTSLSSGAATGGPRRQTTQNANLSPQLGFRVLSAGGSGYGPSQAKGIAQGFGLGLFSLSSGQRTDTMTENTSVFGGYSHQDKGISGGSFVFNTGALGGPVPLIGSLLHASVGANGATGVAAGGSSNANTFFAGSGGGSYTNMAGSAGFGGAGGGGGGSNTGGTAGGAGGNASVNSGAGGGGGGNNTAAPYTNTGNGGNGGSGFVIVGYWG